MDVFKNIGTKVIGQTLKKAAKTAATKAVTTAATKTGGHVGEKAGDKIIKFLSRKKRVNLSKQVTFDEPVEQTKVEALAKKITKPVTQQDRYQQLGLILSDD